MGCRHWTLDIQDIQFFISYLHNETPIVLSKLTVLKSTKHLYLYLDTYTLSSTPAPLGSDDHVFSEPYPIGTLWFWNQMAAAFSQIISRRFGYLSNSIPPELESQKMSWQFAMTVHSPKFTLKIGATSSSLLPLPFSPPLTTPPPFPPFCLLLISLPSCPPSSITSSTARSLKTAEPCKLWEQHRRVSPIQESLVLEIIFEYFQQLFPE